MINIAICDDNHFFCENFICFFKNKYSNIIRTIDDFFNGEELISYIEDSGIIYDFVFLDLDMPKMDGISTGNALRGMETHKNSIIMFITSFDSNAMSVVDIHPFAYVKKPIDYAVLEQKFNTALDSFVSDDNFIILNSKRSTYKLTTKNILYIESMRRKSLIHCVDDITIPVNIRLSDIYHMLHDNNGQPAHWELARIHTSYIINLLHITRTTNTCVYLDNSIQLPLSKLYKNEFFIRFREKFHIL